MSNTKKLIESNKSSKEITKSLTETAFKNMKEDEKIKVAGQFEAIRKSGKTNMMDKNRVQSIASDNDFYELVLMIEDGGYMELLSGYGELKDKLSANDVPDIY